MTLSRRSLLKGLAAAVGGAIVPTAEQLPELPAPDLCSDDEKSIAACFTNDRLRYMIMRFRNRQLNSRKLAVVRMWSRMMACVERDHGYVRSIMAKWRPERMTWTGEISRKALQRMYAEDLRGEWDLPHRVRPTLT